MFTTISTYTHLPFLAVPTVSELPWAVPQLQNNSVLVILIIVFSVVDVLACHPKGMLMHQLSWLGDTRNARTFEASAVIYPWLRPMLLIQLYLFTGLSLFCVFDDAPAAHLQAPTLDTWLLLLYCFVVFLVVQGIQDIVLTPRIMGKVMGLRPAVILLSLSVWGSLLGFIGLIIALPLTTLLSSYYRRYVLKDPVVSAVPDAEKTGES